MLMIAIIIPLSLFIGIAASAIGFTAWPLIIPLFYILFGFDLYLTVFASLLVDCGNALVMTLIGLKHGQVDFRRGLLLAFFAWLWVGASIWTVHAYIPNHENFFKGPASFLVIIFGILFIIKGLKNKPLGSEPAEKINTSELSVDENPEKKGGYLLYSGVALVALIIGFTGAGGGVGYVVFLMIFLSFPILKATGTAMLMTFISTLLAACCYFFMIPENAFVNNDVNYLIPLMIVLSMLGTAVGAKIAYSLSERQIYFFVGNIVIIGGLMTTAQKYFFHKLL